MRHSPTVTGSFTPQAPGRTPQRSPARLRHSASRRASGTTQPQAPHCLLARLRHDVCPGAEDPASRTTSLRVSDMTMRATVLRASGTTSREGGSVELAGGRHARR
jgi:hypothetical protein